MAFLVGFIIGFLMCIPIGPINIWVINTKVKKGSLNAMCIALGGSLMDFIYFFIIMSGLSFVEFNDNTVQVLKTVGIILIFALGVKELLAKNVDSTDFKKEKDIHKLVGAFLLGVVLYTSNPTLIFSMTALAAFIKSLALYPATTLNHFAVALGLAIGSAVWFLFLILFVKRFENKIKDKYLSYFNKVSGALMVCISLFMGKNLFFN
ncbi:MAG: LysE family transporter [Bacteriovoracaceae bacterium]|jgi:threonine/homoserine/homoserine lactone efflux protein|nr:LysE family transporter [Bacteriovoracaceae bacterium]